MRLYEKSGRAITILDSAAYNLGVILQRRHAMYTDIAGTHGTLRNETRPTFNGSKISPSNASIRVDDSGAGSEEGRLGALYVIQRIYTGVYRVPAAPVGLIKHKRSRCDARCGRVRVVARAAIETTAVAVVIIVGIISLARQLKNSGKEA